MAADIGALTAWSTTAGSNQPDASDSIANLDDNLQQIQAQVRKYLATKGADIASASTVDLSTATGNYVHVTGTTTVTALGTVAAGFRFLLVFDGALTFTHNATSLILPSGANITTAAGDRCEVVSLGSGNWRCLWYQKASGEPVSGSYQPLDALLTALAAQTTAAAKIQGYSGSDTATLYDFKDEDDMASDSATALPSQQSVKAYADTKNIATQVTPGTSGNVLTSNGTAWTSATPSAPLTSGTAVATTSGTSIDFTSIPAGTKRITVMVSALSTNGSTAPMIQIGDSGGVETTGYAGSISAPGASSLFSAGFALHTASFAATYVLEGIVILSLQDAATNTWVASGGIGRTDTAAGFSFGGTKSLSATLDRVRLTTTNGTDAFDAGKINILYE